MERVAIGYPRHLVAEDLTATVAEGRLTCLVGRNGTGKSTLLRTLAGMLPLRGGRVTLLGRDTAAMARGEWARLVSVVLTAAPATVRVTVREMVALGRSPYTGFWGALRAEDRRAVDEALSLAGAMPLAGRLMTELSDGERQKVMVARALAQQTPVVLLDEPTAFLDYPSREALMRLLRTLAEEQHKTILLSTHDIHLAARLGHHFLHLADGSLRAERQLAP